MEQRMKHLKKIPVITLKIVSLITVGSMILCAIMFFIGYNQFEDQFVRQYNANIIAVAHSARAVLNADLFEEYLKTNKPDGSWYAVHDILQKFVNQFNLNLLYVSCVEAPEFNIIHYIYNPVRAGTKYKEYPLGYTEEYKHKRYNEAARAIYTEGKEIVRQSTSSKGGTYMTANVPVRNSMGAIIAMLGVQMSTQEFTDAKKAYIRWTLMAEGFFLLVYLIFLIIYYRKQFINPILSITNEAMRFASDSSRISDITKKVKNRDEIGTLAHSVYQMEKDIQDYIKNITQITSEREKAITELNIATRIQAGLLPTVSIDNDNVAIQASMHPAKEVGGDFYDYAMLDECHALAIVADVSGKGVPAALFMAMGTTLLRDHVAVMVRNSTKLAEEIGLVNNVLCCHNDADLFITAWIGILNTKTGRLAYIDAGHNPPLIKQDGKFGYIPRAKKGLPLASMEDFPYTMNELYLKPGDRLFLYTDGVTEAQNKEKELYGEEALLKFAGDHQNDEPGAFLGNLFKELSDFQSGCDQFDDITMVIMDYKGKTI